MARKPRIEFEGAFYHVIARGNQKQKIFRDESDYEQYLKTVAIYKARYDFSLYAYVLMQNHVHLLIQTSSVPLSKTLQGINQSYTAYFNRKYSTVGHLFQGRYKAILCDKESYLLTLVQYIHNNPVRAIKGMQLKDYRWSSHHAYRDAKRSDELVDAGQVLRLFAGDGSSARKLYSAFMKESEAVAGKDVYATIDQRILGDDYFVDRVQSMHQSYIDKERRPWQCSLDEIGSAVTHKYEVPLALLRSASKSSNAVIARKVLSLSARKLGYKGKEIAEYLKKDPASVTGYLKSAPLEEAGMLLAELGRGR